MTTHSLTRAARHPAPHAFLWHVAVPLLGTIALVGLYFTPVNVIGCANRGMAAIAVVIASAVAALVTGWLASQAARREDPSAGWWLVSTVVLLLPIVVLIWPLG
jgi:hypothetical protein